MTITYTHEVANARLGGFSNLLLRWRGSVYKLFYKEFIIYITLYTIISAVYRCINNSEFRQSFEKLCLQFQSYTDLVPISFVLGFYVSMVVGRWWCQYENIPWPDSVMMIVTANVHGSDNRGRLIRRTLLRYLNLAQVLTYRSISTAVFKRFPTIRHVIDAGFMTESEFRQYENVKTENVKYWVPCVWFVNLLCKVRQEGRIYDDMTYHAILEGMNKFRGCCGMLFSYDWISIPLVYTQVVTVAVYVYFMSTLLSRQYLDVTKNYPGHEVDLYVPIFTICQFFFYVGWLKVAEQLINPFGEDDDDFEVNSIIDRNFELSMLTVDNMYMDHPKLERDLYWNVSNPSIPYTAASKTHKMEAFLGSTIDMSLDHQEMQLFANEMNANYEDGMNYTNPLDYNHNAPDFNLKAEERKLLDPNVEISEPQKSAAEKFLRKPENSLVTSIKNHFLSRTQEKDKEVKKSLLAMDFLRPNTSSSSMKDRSLKSASNSIGNANDNCQSTESDESDDGDSDVGDGSEDDEDGLDDSISQRRSSLSSEDGEKDDAENLVDGSSGSILGRKHHMEAPEDRPKAKRLKNSQQVTNKGPLKIANTKLRIPDKGAPNENETGKQSHKNQIMRGKKSPKKRTNLGKFMKWNDAEKRSGGETEQERRNAQIRTLGLLKSTRKKSVHALQRNARRTNYPGNAWLRQQFHPNASRASGIRNFFRWDNTPITSGNEDPNKACGDSPFGSVLSFGTSIPSPKPLRFSYNAKPGRNLQLDSPSASSCMPSPSVYDEYGSSPMFTAYGSPKARPEWLPISPVNAGTSPATSVPSSMPFTEDLRKRLLVVHTNTPSSSTAASPTFCRALPPSSNYHNPFHPLNEDSPQCGYHESDNLLMIVPHQNNSPYSPWRDNLESIGECPAVEKESEPPTNEQRSPNPDKSIENHGILKLPQHKLIMDLKLGSKRNISRSKSCSDVPVSRAANDPLNFEPVPSAKNAKAKREVGAQSEDKKHETKLPKCEQKVPETLANTQEHGTPDVQIHWENESSRKMDKMSDCKRRRNKSDECHIQENRNQDQNCEQKDTAAQESNTLLFPTSVSKDNDSEKERDSSESESDDEKCERVTPSPPVSNNTEAQSDSKSPNTTGKELESEAYDILNSEPLKITVPRFGSLTLDQGYYSAKEDTESIASLHSGEAFQKLRHNSSNPSFLTESSLLNQLQKMTAGQVDSEVVSDVKTDTKSLKDEEGNSHVAHLDSGNSNSKSSECDNTSESEENTDLQSGSDHDFVAISIDN